MTRLIGVYTPLPVGAVLYDGRVRHRHVAPDVEQDKAQLHARIEEMRQPETVYHLTPEEIERVIRHEATPEEIMSQRGGETVAGATGDHVTGERLRELRSKAEALYDEGLGVGVIAKQLGVSWQTVRRWKDNDFQDPSPRPETGSLAASAAALKVDLRTKRRSAEHLKADARAAYEAGDSKEAVGARLGLARSTVYRWALEGRWKRKPDAPGASEGQPTGLPGDAGSGPEKPTEPMMPDWLKQARTSGTGPPGVPWVSPTPNIVFVDQREYLELHRMASRCECSGHGDARYDAGDVQRLASLAMSIASRMLIGEYPRPEVLANEEGVK